MTLGQLIADVYLYAQNIVGLCVFVMFLYAGIGLMIDGDRAKAQKIVLDAVIGTILLFSAVIILNAINPDLTKQSNTTTSSTTR